MAKKGNRIVVAMRCKESNVTSGYTSINKVTTPKLEKKMYNKKLKRHTLHVSKEKLK